MNIVTVQFHNWKGKTGYGGREYSFQTELDLKPGDMVQAPTKQGTSKAQVARVGVDPAEVPAGITLNTITEKVLTREERMEQEILEAWDRWEDSDPDMSTEQLFARVVDETGCDEGDIASALAARHQQEEANVNG